MKKLVLSLALIGMGSFAMAQQAPHRPMPPQRTPEEMAQLRKQREAQHMDELKKDLNLTPAQVAQLQALHDKQQQMHEQERVKNEQLKKAKLQDMKKQREDMDNEIKNILTPEQYQKWDAKRKAKMQERKENFQKHMGEKRKDFGKPMQK